MKQIFNNPFRVIGVYATASERELQKQKNILIEYLNTGEKLSFESDFPLLPPVERNVESIEKAYDQIKNEQDRLLHGLFWFAKSSHIDEVAMDYLRIGNTKKAKQIWKHKTKTKALRQMNVLSYNNLCTLDIIMACSIGLEEKHLIEALKSKFQLLNKDYFPSLSAAFSKSTSIIDQKEILDLFFIEVLDFLCDLCSHEILSSEKTYKVLNDLVKSAHADYRKSLKDKLISVPLTTIEKKINDTALKRINYGKDGVNHGRELIKSVNGYWQLLKNKIPEELALKMIGDSLAQELLDCGVDFINEHFNDRSKSQIEKNQIVFNDSLLDLLRTAKEYTNTMDLLQEIEYKEVYVRDIVMRTRRTGYFRPVEKELQYLAKRINLLDQSIYEALSQESIVFNPPKTIHEFSHQVFSLIEACWNDCKEPLSHINAVLKTKDPFILELNSEIIEKIMVLMMRQINALQGLFDKNRNSLLAELSLLSFFREALKYPVSSQLYKRITKNIATLESNIRH